MIAFLMPLRDEFCRGVLFFVKILLTQRIICAIIVYDISTNYRSEDIENLERNELYTTQQIKSKGYSNSAITRAVKSGKLQRVAHGLYNLPKSDSDAVFDDEMYQLGLRFKQLVFSHDTALYLHDLNDRDPIGYSITLPTGYNTKTLLSEGFKVFSLKKELHEHGVIEKQTMYGNLVRTYSLERTICDCLRSRSRLPKDIVATALKRYVKRPDRDLAALAQTAKMFNITKILETYMEVLL